MLRKHVSQLLCRDDRLLRSPYLSRAAYLEALDGEESSRVTPRRRFRLQAFLGVVGVLGGTP